MTKMTKEEARSKMCPACRVRSSLRSFPDAIKRQTIKP